MAETVLFWAIFSRSYLLYSLRNIIEIKEHFFQDLFETSGFGLRLTDFQRIHDNPFIKLWFYDIAGKSILSWIQDSFAHCCDCIKKANTK